MHDRPLRRSPWRRLAVAGLLTLPLLGCPPQDRCTPPPPLPKGAPVAADEWSASVRTNCFSDLERLNRWYGQDKPLAAGKSPAGLYIPVGENGIESGSVVVVVHGWAPGFRAAVERAGGNLLWWGPGATDASGVWTSDWAWVPSKGTAEPLEIAANGLFQEIYARDPKTVVLGYSWIDDSATIDDSYADVEYVYRSEAYTSINGLRLAEALEQALAPSFWTGSGNSLHLIGHSHGSKVATVAAQALQKRGRRVDHLTTLDSPESDLTLEGNGSNLLGFYLDHMGVGGIEGLFADNYVSYFGAGFHGTPSSDAVVEVVLDPAVYHCDDAGDRHSYSAEWYGAAAAAGAKYQAGPLGLAWPPPQTPFRPALNQQWAGGYTESQQWPLTAGAFGSLGCLSTAESCAYPTASISVEKLGSTGNVTGTPATGLTFGAGSGGADSSYHGSTGFGSSQYGIAFDVEWIAPATGDYLVFTGSDAFGTQEVLMVMDGKSAITGSHPVAINSYVIDSLDFWIWYLPAAGNTQGTVKIGDFRSVSQVCDGSAAEADGVGAGGGEEEPGSDGT